MNFVPKVPNHLVTDLMYRRFRSWHAVGCYFDWRKHYEAEQLKAQGIGRRRGDGSVLTAEGWVLPTGRHNPRVIDANDKPAVIDRKQAQIDSEVAQQEIDHEAAVLDEDMAVFYAQWSLTVGPLELWAGRAWPADAHSAEREAFIARWVNEARPH